MQREFQAAISTADPLVERGSVRLKRLAFRLATLSLHYRYAIETHVLKRQFCHNSHVCVFCAVLLVLMSYYLTVPSCACHAAQGGRTDISSQRLCLGQDWDARPFPTKIQNTSNQNSPSISMWVLDYPTGTPYTTNRWLHAADCESFTEPC